MSTSIGIDRIKAVFGRQLPLFSAEFGEVWANPNQTLEEVGTIAVDLGPDLGNSWPKLRLPAWRAEMDLAFALPTNGKISPISEVIWPKVVDYGRARRGNVYVVGGRNFDQFGGDFEKIGGNFEKTAGKFGACVENHSIFRIGVPCTSSCENS